MNNNKAHSKKYKSQNVSKESSNVSKESSNVSRESPNEIESECDLVLGIDLGTRFSCVSIWRNKRFEIICDQFGNRTLPSVVAFYKSAKLVGHNALSLKEVSPHNTIYDVKRIIGRRSDDPTIEQTKKLITYHLTDDETEHRNVLIELDKSDTGITHKLLYRPEEIAASILIEIKKMAYNYLKQDVTKAVITVPAYFNDSQRQATLDAARIAGLDVLKIINEPTSAALAYGLGSKTWVNKKGGNVIIYDFGAGTLDVSLMNISNGVFRTLAVGGNTHLGGEDIDYLLMNFVIMEFRKQHRIKKFEPSKLSLLRLKNATENAKKFYRTQTKPSSVLIIFIKI
jgi:molecular chaperone DnaK (HSP70)